MTTRHNMHKRPFETEHDFVYMTMDENFIKLRTVLIDIENRLSNDDRSSLCFLLHGDVPRRDLDIVARDHNSTMNAIWTALIDRKKIDPNNVEYLTARLEKIRRIDLARKLKEYSLLSRTTTIKTEKPTAPSDFFIHLAFDFLCEQMPSDIDFRELLISLDDHMSTEDRKRFIFLLGDDIPRRNRDDSLFDIFTILIDRGRILPTDCTYLIEIFQRIKLITLAYKIAQFQARSDPAVRHPIGLETPSANISIPKTPAESNCDLQNDLPTIDQLISNFNLTDAAETSNSQTTTLDAIDSSRPTIPSWEYVKFKALESGPWPEELLKRFNIKIRPYEYQREVVQSAIRAGNTIICLRQGSGKTVIAALLLKYYMAKKMAQPEKNRSKYLAFFMVPRCNMIKHKAQILERVGNFRVATSGDNEDVPRYINDTDVVVCTPRKLHNYLRTRAIPLANIDLLCFNECCEASEYSTYVEIMQCLMCPSSGLVSPNEPTPIIIGLTAVIAPRRSVSSSPVYQMAKLCATFNCSTVTTVLDKENQMELEKNISGLMRDEIIDVERDNEFDALVLSVDKELKDFILECFIHEDTNPFRIFVDEDINSNAYEHYLETLKRSEQMKEHYPPVLLLSYALAFYRYLKMLAVLTPEIVLSSLKSFLEMVHGRRESPMEIDKLIYEKSRCALGKILTGIKTSKPVPTNPILNKLVALLKKQASEINSKAIVLVDRAFYARSICEYLQNHSELKNFIKPCYLERSSWVRPKQNDKGRDSMLDDFCKGKYNVMISTDISVATLDIYGCTLVVRYDYVPENAWTVGISSRVRVSNRSSYFITVKESFNYKKELETRQYEQDTKEALEKWSELPVDKFKARVNYEQASIVGKWNEALNKASIVIDNKEMDGDVLCRHCGFVLGKFSQIRSYNCAYFIHDPDFYNRVGEKLVSEPRHHSDSSIIGKTLCGNRSCRAELGCIRVFKKYPTSSPIYPLKCKCIAVKQIEKATGTERMIQRRKWKKMPFKIPSLEIAALQENVEDPFYDASDVSLYE